MIEAGGEARLIYLAWRYGNEDPYRLYNNLDEEYRPYGVPDVEPVPPQRAGRVRYFVYGCGAYAQTEAIRLAGGKVPKRRRRGGGPPPMRHPRQG